MKPHRAPHGGRRGWVVRCFPRRQLSPRTAFSFPYLRFWSRLSRSGTAPKNFTFGLTPFRNRAQNTFGVLMDIAPKAPENFQGPEEGCGVFARTPAPVERARMSANDPSKLTSFLSPPRWSGGHDFFGLLARDRQQHFRLTADALASFLRRRCHAFFLGNAAA